MFTTDIDNVNTQLKILFGHLGMGNFDVEFIRQHSDPSGFILHLSRKLKILDFNIKTTEDVAMMCCEEIMNNPIFTAKLDKKDQEIEKLKKEIEDIKTKALEKAIG